MTGVRDNQLCSKRHRLSRRFCALIAVCASVSFAVAQQPRRGGARPDRPGPPPRGDFPGPDRDGKGPRMGPGEREGPLRLFMPRPQDHGPLRDGEEEQLLDFAQQHIPRMYRHLQNAQRMQGNERFQRRFRREIVPLLRHLKRINDADPALGALQIRHAELRVQLLRRAPAIVRNANGPLPPRLLREMRSRMAEMVNIEKEVIERELKALEENPDSTINRRMDELIDEDYDPVVEPPEVREFVYGFRAAEGDIARLQIKDKLREKVEREINLQKRALQIHLKRLTNDTDEIIDERMQRIEDHSKDGERPPRRRGRNRGRG